MVIDLIPELRLSAADDAQIAALMASAFDDGYDGRSFYQQRYHQRVVARDGERIISHIGASISDIRMGDDAVTVVGLGDVATDPTCQRQGIASQLLRAAIHEATRSIASFVILFGDAGIYATGGFVPMPNTIRFISLLGNRTRTVYEKPSNALMVLPLGDRIWDPDALIDLVGHPI